MKITYEEILMFDNLDNFLPEQVISILGILFEIGREQKNPNVIKKGLEFAEKHITTTFDAHPKMVFHYNVANGWSYLQMLTQELNSNEFWEFDFELLEKQIINLRLALNYSENVDDNFKKSEILTNLGNLFSQIGRFSEAQSYWNLAVEITPNFPMAIGNIGFGLVHYAEVLYDEGHQSLFIKFSHKYLKQAIKSEIYEDAKVSFKKIINYFESHYDKKQLTKITNLNNFQIAKSKNEELYRKWCLKNRLFLNPLNDIITDNIASYDCLFLPSITLEFNAPPFYQTIFNQIKQEFVSARYLFYEGVNLKKAHFSDRYNLQMDTLDYAVYSYNTEKIKISYRLVYSILDKIGYLLNDYLKLGFEAGNVTFRKIWYEYDKKNKTKSINSKISNTQNWAFRGLFWLSKDFYEEKISFLSSIEPEAKELAKIRNFIEHKSFKIVDFGDTEIVDNGLTYLINREEFEKKTMKLIKLARASIIYLSLGINIEEQKREDDNITFPVNFFELNDRYKI